MLHNTSIVVEFDTIRTRPELVVPGVVCVFHDD